MVYMVSNGKIFNGKEMSDNEDSFWGRSQNDMLVLDMLYDSYKEISIIYQWICSFEFFWIEEFF